ncbi:MAG: penicillin acylase family protein [Chloroflexota bacterium]
MTSISPPLDFAAAQSLKDGTLDARGLLASLTLRRDHYGIAHLRAANEHDAWFGQGFASAQDRLWQMEYDRRRAVGRWAEVAGPDSVAGDVLARRLQLERSARADVAAMSAATRAMFEAYAAGVNAFLHSGQPLPVEYRITGLTPEPWEPWHSAVSFKIRHVLMGPWQQKLARGVLLARVGVETYAKLEGRPPAGSPVILPPGSAVAPLLELAVEEIVAAARQLGFLAEVEAGSNSWAVHGSRTTSGSPVLCNDSHRALDVPNVYWQIHVTCPALDVIGATFPGVPGFPHFGHNGRVGWNITHAMADNQDLYVEQFDVDNSGHYRTPEGRATAEQRRETITVRGGEPVTVELWRTGHGPIVHGDPRRGPALALRYTGTEEPNRGFEVLRPMLTARTVAELLEVQRGWVDPGNNLVCADSDGNIAYQTRGRVPVRQGEAHRHVPVPGWTGEHEWDGDVPFERLPRAINPPEGFIATANQRIIAADAPYLGAFYATPFRAQRIVNLLTAGDRLTPEQVMALQGDTTSLAAQAWSRLFHRLGPFGGDAEQARRLLGVWDGNLLPADPAALLYACFRRAVARRLFAPLVGREVWTWLAGGTSPATGTIVGQWLGNLVWRLDEDGTPPDGSDWATVLPGPLAEAWAAAGSPDAAGRRWDAVHATNAQHPLVALFPEQAAALNPPRVPMGGDADTIQAAGYPWSPGTPFDVTGLSVYRQVIDLSDIATSTFVIPGGASGLPGTPHFADQLEPWRAHRRVPMWYREEDVAAAAVHTLTLRPAG